MLLLNTDYLLIAAACFVGLIFLLILFFTHCYKRCSSNNILAVYGKIGGNQSVKCYHGGTAFVWPFIQGYNYLDLTPMTINIPLRGALSSRNIRIDVPSTFTVAISTTPSIVINAAIRLLSLTKKEVESMASEIIFGQLRLTIASLTIEQINQDRELFFEAIRHNIEPELKKIGLSLINVNITDIHDESGYITSIGKKAIASALNQAKIDVAKQHKHGEIGEAEAKREQRIAVAQYNAQAVAGENESQAKIAQYNATLAEQEALARKRSLVAEQQANAAIEEARAETERQRLEAEVIVVEKIEKQKREIKAEAVAIQRRKEAAGEADAIIAIKQAESEGISKILQSKANGYRMLVESCGNNTQDAATMLLVEKLEEIVKLQTEAIKNIKIDKITVWDSGSKETGSSTAHFLSNMVKSLPALHDIASMAGLQLPEYLGSVKHKNYKIPHNPKEKKDISKMHQIKNTKIKQSEI